MTTRDCLDELFDDLRTERPLLQHGAEWDAWLTSMGECICAMPTRARRWGAIKAISEDICTAMPGNGLVVAHLSIQAAVLRAGGGA